MSRWIWHLLALSLPLDLLLFLIPPLPYDALPIALTLQTALGILLAATLLLWLGRAVVLSFVDRSQGFSTQLLQRSPWVPLALAGAIIALIFLEVLMKTGAKGWLSFGVALVITLGALRPVWKGLQEHLERARKFRRDRTYWIEQMNVTMFVLTVSPLVGSRLVSLLGIALYLGGLYPWWFGALAFFASYLLLTAQEPDEADFLFHCGRCGAQSSIALKKIGFCPLCADDLGITSFAGAYTGPNKNRETRPEIEDRAGLSGSGRPAEVLDSLRKVLEDLSRKSSVTRTKTATSTERRNV